mgnify:CR=1 FL=1
MLFRSRDLWTWFSLPMWFGKIPFRMISFPSVNIAKIFCLKNSFPLGATLTSFFQETLTQSRVANHGIFHLDVTVGILDHLESGRLNGDTNFELTD